MTFDELIKSLQLSKQQVDAGLASLADALAKHQPWSKTDPQPSRPLTCDPDQELKELLIQLGVLPEKE